MGRSRFDGTSLTIAEMLREWDLLGVDVDSDNRPEDDEECDDLVDPLRGWLEEGADALTVSANLCAFVEQDYGLSPQPPLSALDFTQPLREWWMSRAIVRRSSSTTIRHPQSVPLCEYRLVYSVHEYDDDQGVHRAQRSHQP